MSDLISRQAAIDIVEFECGEWIGLARTIIKRLDALSSAEPEKNELMTDFVDTAEKAAKVEIMSKKDAQVSLDNWKKCNHISEADHGTD